MRIALVSPYSWSYQGGVNRHVEALAEEFLGRGHHVRVLAPFDPPGRLSRVLHRGQPHSREVPDYLVPLGRSAGFGANGAVSLDTFMSYGGNTDLRAWNQLLSGITPHLDFTFFAGFLVSINFVRLWPAIPTPSFRAR